MAYFYLFFAQLMVAINIVGSKYLVHHISILTVLTLRFSIATIFLLFVHLLRRHDSTVSLRKLSYEEWGLILAQALCAGVLFNALLLFGLYHTQAVMAGMLISALPALIALAALIFLKEKLSLATALCICLAMAGLLIINGRSIQLGNEHRLIGDSLILVALIPEVIYYLLSRMYKNRLPLFLLSALMNGVNVLCLLPLFIWFRLASVMQIDAQSLEVLLITGLASAYFYITWYLGSQQIRASSAGLFTALGPVLTLLIAAYFLGESLTLFQLLGMTLIIFSVLVSALKSSR